MHWAERIADELIAENPGKEEFLCAAGTSPSGSVHIGNFRDVATPFFVVKALRAKGKKARLMLSWDDFDRLRKVPKNIAAIDPDFGKYLGMPYSMIPDPNGKCESFADYYEKEYEKSLEELGIDIEYRYQGKEYRSGRYVDGIIKAMHARKEIYDILMKYKTQDSDEGERGNYYPLSVYCSDCVKDFTEILSYDEDAENITYRCKVCGKTETVNLRDYHLVKLMWKIDWPMRWGVEGVDFEPGGIDHAAASGSFVVAKEIADKIFGVNIMLMSPFAEEVSDVVVEEGIKVITTGAGNPGKYMAKWLEAGIKVIPVVPSVALARKMEKDGAFAVIAEGGESGGHVGDLTTMALVPQVVDAVNIPVVAAGGIADGRQIAAAFMLGAQGVQVGTRFLVAKECTISQEYKNKILKARDIDTVVTGKRLGHPVRSIRNSFTREYTKAEYDSANVSDEELENMGLGRLRRAVREGDVSQGTVLAGQVASMVKKEQPAREMIEEMFSQAEEVLNGATKWVK